MSVLSLLGLFSSSYFPSIDSEEDWAIEKEEMLLLLGKFVRQFERQQQQATSISTSYAVTVGATLASAFVSGQLTLPSVIGDAEDTLSKGSKIWNPVEGSSKSDRELGWAIALFCTLAVAATAPSSSSNNTSEVAAMTTKATNDK